MQVPSVASCRLMSMSSLASILSSTPLVPTGREITFCIFPFLSVTVVVQSPPPQRTTRGSALNSSGWQGTSQVIELRLLCAFARERSISRATSRIGVRSVLTWRPARRRNQRRLTLVSQPKIFNKPFVFHRKRQDLWSYSVKFTIFVIYLVYFFL